ncbi:MAG: FAD-binding oxidoreductase [Planctomicrobium sp.]|jgi:FAD/FMN-containing dehydrogenase|nr:FAD-binding oxidoreductase [Planctomicrobium sp.]
MSQSESSAGTEKTQESTTPNDITRREALAQTSLGLTGLALGTFASSLSAEKLKTGVVLNDVQSQLNRTVVNEVLKPDSNDQLKKALEQAADSQLNISQAGGRHSMGGQQFGAGNLHLDMTSLSKVISLDTELGLVTVQAGIQWPELIRELYQRQPEDPQPWTIREKQTGVDSVTIGGAVSSNIHGRSLAHAPFVSDVESFDLIDVNGVAQHCSRSLNTELFSLVIGGYGLFGLISQVTLRLVRRFKVRRRVKVIKVKDLLENYHRRIEEGFVFGDCQYATLLAGASESHQGVFPCYEPVDLKTPIEANQKQLTAEQWAGFYKLMRSNKRQAFKEYAAHYRSTEGQTYWSDTHQLAGNFEGHRKAVDSSKGTEMITEVYLPFQQLNEFLIKTREDLMQRDADITYGTIRFIKADEETFLPWAKQDSVCIVCNLHVKQSPEGIRKAKADFRQIIDRTIQFGGTFFLTYHRWATSEQISACYPNIRQFFALKRKYDPDELLQSDWYRHYAEHFS